MTADDASSHTSSSSANRRSRRRHPNNNPNNSTSDHDDDEHDNLSEGEDGGATIDATAVQVIMQQPHNDSDDDNDEDEEEHEHVGYTPLDHVQFDMSGYIMHTNDNNNDSDTDNDDNQEGGMTFTFRPLHGDNSDLPEAENRITNGSLSSSPLETPPMEAVIPPTPRNYESLALDALQALEEEYRTTTNVATTNVPNLEGESNAVAPAVIESNEANAVQEQDVQLSSDKDTTEPQPPPEPRPDPPEVKSPSSAKESPEPPNLTLNPKPKQEAPKANVDINRIQKAMHAIRLKSPTLATHLDQGGAALAQSLAKTPSSTNPPPKHALIPSAPLAAFQSTHTSEKALQASRNLSRSATLAEALVRLGLFSQSLKEKETDKCNLVVHVVGVDHVECASPQTVRHAFRPLIRWLDAAAASASQTTPCKRRVELVLVGPNVPSSMHDTKVDLLPQGENTSRAGLEEATAKCISGLYHEFLASSSTKVNAGTTDATTPTTHTPPPSTTTTEIEARSNTTTPSAWPDLMISFNAGIWGYSDWTDTLSWMLSQKPSYKKKNEDDEEKQRREDACAMARGIPWIVTAYTLEEAKLDAEALAACFSQHDGTAEDDDPSDHEGNNGSERQVWGPSPNPYAARKPKEPQPKTAPKGAQVYVENYAWQAWWI